MELRHIRTFLALAEELHFGRTARRMHVVQSAVSQTIKALEEQVGAALFSRAPRAVTLTPAGVALLASCRAALVELERGTVAARKAASGEQGRLRLCFGPLSALTMLPRLVATYQRALPGVQVDIETLGSNEQLAALRDGRTDLGFLPLGKHDFGGLQTRIVVLAPVVAIVGRRHRLAKRRSVAFRELSGETFLLADQLRDRAELERRFAEAGFVPRAVLQLDRLETLLAFAAAGLGISFLPALLEDFGARRVAMVPVRPKISAGIVAVWNDARLPATCRRFLELLPNAATPGP
jgi:DNA-binding transcriptional LysR family regulator